MQADSLRYISLQKVTVTFKVTVTVAFRYGWISTPL